MLFFSPQDTLVEPPTEVYMMHRSRGMVRQLQFCPYEDVLGVGSTDGFESLLIPGQYAAEMSCQPMRRCSIVVLGIPSDIWANCQSAVQG